MPGKHLTQKDYDEKREYCLSFVSFDLSFLFRWHERTYRFLVWNGLVYGERGLFQAALS